MIYACLVPHPPRIIPGVGSGSGMPPIRRAYGQITAELAALRPDTLIVISPYSAMCGDYI